MSKKLRELLAKLTVVMTELKSHSEILETKGKEKDFDLKAYDVTLDDLELKKANLDREIRVEKALVTNHDLKIVDDPKDKKDFTKMENVLASPEYKVDYFRCLQGKMTVADLEVKFGSSIIGSMGAAIPESTMNTVIAELEQESALLGLVRVENITGNLRIAVEKSSDGANVHAEGDDIAEEDLVLEEVVWGFYEVAKLVSISKTVATQSISALESFIIGEITRKLAVKVEQLLATGTGISQPTGLLVDTRITNEPSIGTLSYATLIEIIAALPTMYHRGAKFAMNRLTYFNEVVGIVDNEGQPIFKIGTTETGPAFTILGYPVEIVDVYPVHADATALDKTMTFGRHESFLVNFGMPATIDKSLESSFRKGLVDYRGCLIMDSKALDPRGLVRVVKA